MFVKCSGFLLAFEDVWKEILCISSFKAVFFEQRSCGHASFHAQQVFNDIYFVVFGCVLLKVVNHYVFFGEKHTNQGMSISELEMRI